MEMCRFFGPPCIYWLSAINVDLSEQQGPECKGGCQVTAPLASVVLASGWNQDSELVLAATTLQQFRF